MRPGSKELPLLHVNALEKKQGPRWPKPWPIQTVADFQSYCTESFKLSRQLQNVKTPGESWALSY